MEVNGSYEYKRNPHLTPENVEVDEKEYTLSISQTDHWI